MIVSQPGSVMCDAFTLFGAEEADAADHQAPDGKPVVKLNELQKIQKQKILDMDTTKLCEEVFTAHKALKLLMQANIDVTMINESIQDSKQEWAIIINGEKGTPYEHGAFEIEIEFPIHGFHTHVVTPTCKMNSNIYHPNFFLHEEFYVDRLWTNHELWPENIGMLNLIRMISSLISCPDPNTQICNPEALALFENNPTAFKVKAKEETEKWAMAKK